MRLQINILSAILVLCTQLATQAQDANPSLIAKSSRSSQPVNTSALHARTINGGQQTAHARVAVSGNPYIIAQPWANQPTWTVPDRFEIKKSTHTGLPIFIKGKAADNPQMRLDASQASFAYLNEVKGIMRIQDPVTEFKLRQSETDQLQQVHQRMSQVYRGIPVYGGEIILHRQNGQVESLNGRYFATPQLADVNPSITQSQAIEQANRHVQTRTEFHELSAAQRKLLDYQHGPDALLVIYHTGESVQLPHLAWHVSLRPNFVEHWEYFIDAKTGAVIHQYNHTCSIDGGRTATAKDLNGVNQTFNTYQAGADYYFMDASKPMFNAAKSAFPEEPIGIVWTLDAKNTALGKNFTAYHISSTNNAWNTPSAVSAHFNGGKAFEYFKTVHNRNSINGEGGNVISFINVADKDGKGMDNAAWNGKAIFYGNGNIAFKPLAGALDAAGHEMTHGVIDNTANLEYQGQSGAINESMADVFGAMMDNDDWTIGEDIVKKTYYTSGAMRDMSDPHNGGHSLSDRGYQPRVMAELYTGTEDNGGVHINSGIPNYAFYLFATSISKAKAEKVYYRALTQYLTAKSQFIDLRLAVIQAAVDLHGANSAEVNAAKAAFDQVGIFETGSNSQPDLPEHPGADFILVHDASTNDPNSWYTSSTTGTNLSARSQTRSKNRPSVTDDGSKAVYVAKDSKIYSITLSGSANQMLIQDQAIWDNVAVSKDGTKLAAVSISADTTIYVYDFGKEEWAEFKLYNPTYSDGVQTAGVLFADALEWDYTGEYLVYDAYNVIKKSNGKSLNYWDVGVIRVWDKEKNDFGDGKIEKLFTNLPEKVNIANPSFSKKSPYIAAFDYIDTKDKTYKVIAANLKTGEAGLIIDNNITGVPTYSKSDNQIAYTTIDNEGDTVVAVISLKADKINANGAPTTILTEAKWPVWFAQGNRQLQSSQKDILQFSFPGLNQPAVGVVNGNTIRVNVAQDVDVTNLIATFTVSPLAVVKVGSAKQVSGATKNNFAQPLTYTVTAQDGSTKSYTVTVKKGIETGLGDENDESSLVTLYPNPNQGTFRLSWDRVETATIHLQVFSSTGRAVYEQTIPAYQNNHGIELQLPAVQPGVYYLQMQSAQKTAYKKLIVN
jgi:bacillolysin